MFSRKLQLLVIVLTMGCVQTKADSCLDIKLPEQVRQKLSTAYVGWQIVTAARPPDEDRGTWKDCCAKECPGVIQGKFTDDGQEYVINLIRKTQNKTFQQIILFRENENGLGVVTIDPSSVVGVVSVIRKGPSGTYRDRYEARSIKAERDVIIVSEIDAGALAYYWDGTRFRWISISI